ncbi:MAG: pyridoxamine 5'-phosphate oxidase family protein [Rhodomicrobium sp.]|nr:pyridoxamine 5'-phosphate oxidase family protein [Rhodomicrobium sp.]
MAHRYAELMFTPAVERVQEQRGSRAGNARRKTAPGVSNERLGPEEAAFVAARDNFYMATASTLGQPYIQHRGGPIGFVKVFGQRWLGFPDYRGNRQYISVGNLAENNRCALIFVDYASRRRLKLVGRAHIIEASDSAFVARLADPAYAAKLERAILITIDAYDWNCPQHITPRFTEAEARVRFAPETHIAMEG